jgi:transcriptional regulator with GAF, ATPase, and Fis domain
MGASFQRMPPPGELANPKRIGRWHLLESAGTPAGEGATSLVWKARGSDDPQEVAAIKVARRAPGAAEALGREAVLLARVGRRWGPAILDAGPGFLVTEWVDGVPLDVRALRDRDRLAMLVAHGVGRALEELHQAGVRHGDVKPANVLRSTRAPLKDSADDRAVTLIDLGLATDFATAPLGGTPRYAAPELRHSGEGGPAADLWALGILLAEILDPRVADAADPLAAVKAWGPSAGEAARWVEALVAAQPGGRPSASWLATRAGRALGLQEDPRESSLARVARVRRAYLAERGRDIAPGAGVSAAVSEPARGWLEQVVAIASSVSPGAARAESIDSEGESAGVLSARRPIEPLGAVRRARWLVSLVGPAAAAWPVGQDERTAGEIVGRAVELARERDPSAWVLKDIAGDIGPREATWNPGEGDERVPRLVRELARACPAAVAFPLAEDHLAADPSSTTLAIALAAALFRAGDTGRAWAALGQATGPEADALRAEVARRRGEVEAATRWAERAVAAGDGPPAWTAKATLARLAWDAGDLSRAERHLEGARGAPPAEVRALLAWRRGAYEPALAEVERALADPLEPDAYARLESVRGTLELARGNAPLALDAFARAVELATRAGAVVDEATYLTNEAAAATEVGDIARALASATRAAFLWERLGSPARAARAWLARAGSLATIGAVHATDESAREAYVHALASRDARAAAYARWAQVEVRPAGDPGARLWAIEADERLSDGGTDEDRARAAARLLVWASDAIAEDRIAAVDRQVASLGAPVRWEWWGARAAAILAGRRSDGDAGVLPALVALVDVPALLSSRGPALDAAAHLATARGDGEAARRLEHARVAAAHALREGTPPAYRAFLAGVSWARASSIEAADVAFAPAQVAQLEAIVRSLSARNGLRPLLEQVLDTLVLWTGVERGLLLLRAPDGRLVPRAARNLARHDLAGEQLALSQTIARRAIDSGDAVVATDAFSTLGDVHASVHALKLRSVLAVPLAARGETLGVVYLDDRVRKGAFGPRELAWVRVVASQAAIAIADARDAVLLRRAVRRAERARARLESALSEREAQLDVTRTQLEMARDSRETRYRYDEIAGRSEPMRELLRVVDRVTASDVPVLVVGESGTGKELVARAMHNNGPRGRRTFVSENCASVPESLLESTLFGHVKGAFTGASSTRAGLFDVADGGTLFLDEIGEMPLAMQAKLLRVLQDGEVRALGGERPRKVDVRVIAATHRDLEAMVAAGQFREDLFYRLNVITLRVPALRERPADIPLLVDHFVRKHAGDRKVRVTRNAMAKMVAFAWPGNVRQLENEVRRAIVLGDGVIDVAELSPDVARGGPSAARGSGLDLRTRVDALEAELVNEALTKTGGNQTRAAQMLGLSRFGLQKMMKRLKIKAGK